MSSLPVDWCLPADWIMKPLGEVATLQRGFDLPVQDRLDGHVKIYAANGPVGTHNEPKVRGPGVVTGRSGSIGKVHYVADDYWPLNTALWVKDFHGNDPRWVSRLLTWMQLEQFTRGVGVPTLNRNLVHEVKIPLPPLEEQKRIAGILDQADALRRLRTRALDKVNTLGQAIFHEMFGDVGVNDKGLPKVRVGTVCERVSVGVVIKPASHYVDGGVPAIRGTNIKLHGLDLSDLVFFTPEASNGPLKKSRVASGDVLAVRSGRPGLATVVPEELDGANCIDVLIATTKRKSLLPEYLRDFLNSPDGRALVLSNSRGQVQQHFNVKSLAEAEIPLPTISEQRTYLERISEVEQQRRILLNE